MPALVVMFGSVGSLLVVVSAVGGELTFGRVKVPRVDSISRVLCGTAGSFLVAAAVFGAVLAPMLQLSRGSEALNGPANDPSGNVAMGAGPGMDPEQVAVVALRHRQSFRMRPDDELVRDTVFACDLMGAGRNGSDVVAELRGSDVTSSDAQYLVTVALGTVCPGSG